MITSKEKLMAWVDGLRDIDLPTRWVLEKLARFADAERLGWSPVPYLQEVSGLSKRKIQYILRDLEALGLILKTDRTHRLEGSTRSVPLYKIDPSGESTGAPAMGARGAPIEPHGCTDDGGMGAQGVHPHKELKELIDANASNAGASARADFVQGVQVALEAAYPRKALAWSDPAQVTDALTGLIEGGIDTDKLVAAAAAFAASPELKRRDYGPPKLEAWLRKAQYRGHWPEDAAVAAVVAPDAAGLAGEGLPAEVRDQFGAAFVATWLGGATWDAETRVLTCRPSAARKITADRHADLRALGATVEERRPNREAR